MIVRLGASKTQPVTAYHRSNSTVYACLIVQLFVVYPKFATQQRSTTTHTNTFSPYYDEPPEKSHSVSRAQTEFVREQHCSRDLHTKTVLSVYKEIAAIRSREALLYIYSDALSSHRPLFFLWYWKTAAPFLLYIIYTHIHIHIYTTTCSLTASNRAGIKWIKGPPHQHTIITNTALRLRHMILNTCSRSPRSRHANASAQLWKISCASLQQRWFLICWSRCHCLQNVYNKCMYMLIILYAFFVCAHVWRPRLCLRCFCIIIIMDSDHEMCVDRVCGIYTYNNERINLWTAEEHAHVDRNFYCCPYTYWNLTIFFLFEVRCALLETIGSCPMQIFIGHNATPNRNLSECPIRLQSD